MYLDVGGREKGRGKREEGESEGGRKVNDLYFTIRYLELDINHRGRGKRERKGEEKKGERRWGKKRTFFSKMAFD